MGATLAFLVVASTKISRNAQGEPDNPRKNIDCPSGEFFHVSDVTRPGCYPGLAAIFQPLEIEEEGVADISEGDDDGTGGTGGETCGELGACTEWADCGEIVNVVCVNGCCQLPIQR